VALTLSALQAARDALVTARIGGLREVQDANGERVVYKSDSEMARALAALDAEIAAASRRPSNTIVFNTSKGL
jgi:hypothetical protein